MVEYSELLEMSHKEQHLVLLLGSVFKASAGKIAWESGSKSRLEKTENTPN